MLNTCQCNHWQNWDAHAGRRGWSSSPACAGKALSNEAQSLGPLVLWRKHRPPGGAVAAEISKAVASSPILNQKSLGPAVSICVVFRKYG